MKLLVFAIFLVLLSPCLGYQDQDHTSSEEELDPADVEEPGCPRITHLKEIDLRHVIKIYTLQMSHLVSYDFIFLFLKVLRRMASTLS
jgi:hypothetical protein